MALSSGGGGCVVTPLEGGGNDELIRLGQGDLAHCGKNIPGESAEGGRGDSYSYVGWVRDCADGASGYSLSLSGGSGFPNWVRTWARC